MRNIGGTYDLADQLPSNHEFAHFLVVSQSQVPREFGVNLALLFYHSLTTLSSQLNGKGRVTGVSYQWCGSEIAKEIKQ